ncbi:MAG: hypothetical protein KKB79_01390 [Nanoarchaeota archaeon]|nr:hypothetical protein [Nanoarchaeota archaeon]
MPEQEQTEAEQLRDDKRAVALKNLKAEHLVNLAVAYHAQSENSGYGKADNDAVQKYLYANSLSPASILGEDGNEHTLIEKTLAESRQDGKAYTGQVSEYGLIKSAARIIQDSLKVIKVNDVLELLGSDVMISGDYNDKYVSDLMESEDDDVKTVAKVLMGGYINHVVSKKVAEALGKRADDAKSGLENLVK